MARLIKHLASLTAITTVSIRIAFNAAAQPVESFRASTNITPQVESFQIAKSGDLTPSLYTGAMAYSLPLYTYSDPDFDIPVSLDYNYDGYKVARSSGAVGLGWALNCGGVITREIRGLKDEYVMDNFDGDNHTRYGYYWVYKNHVAIDYQFTTSRPRTTDPGTISTPKELVRLLNDDLYEDVPVSTYGNSYDLSPDLFHFSFGPYSGDFMMNHDGTLTLTSPTHPQGEFDVKIETTPGLDGYSLKFTIMTGDGYEYTFGDARSAREYHASTVIKDECPDDGNMTGTISGWTDTAWKLTRIKAPNGRTVTFTYEARPSLTPTVTYSYSTFTQLLPTTEAMPMPTDSVPSWERVNLNYAYSHPVRQILVCGPDGSSTESEVSLYWTDKTSSEDETAAANYGYGALVADYLNRAPLNPRDVKLSSIMVRNAEGETVRTLRLVQSHIGSLSGARRMTLQSVYDSKNGRWAFSYDGGPGSLPEFDSRRHDLWGFWCQSYLDPRQQRSQYDLIRDTPNFVERLDYLRSGALTKITYPTGGWSEISYEGNKAESALNRSMHNPPHPEYYGGECGGIRVREIYSRPFDSEKGLRRTYAYSDGELLSLRWIRFETDYWKYWGQSERTYLKGIFYSNDVLSNGSYDNMIGYRQVRETYPDGSYVVHRFNGYSEYADVYLRTGADWLDADSSPGTTDVSAKDHVRMIPMLASPEQIYSDFRGKTKSVEEYDSAGRLRKRTTYSYMTLAGMTEYRFFNMMTGWMSFYQSRFYPKLSDTEVTSYEPASGATSGMSFSVSQSYDRKTGQLLRESVGTLDKYSSTEYVYCSSASTKEDTSPLKAAVSDVITSVTENGDTFYTGRFHFGYRPDMKGIHPVSLTEYVLDIPSSSSPSKANCRTETTDVTYNGLLRPVRVDMPGGAYLEYDWDDSGKHIVGKTVNGEEGRTEYGWKDLVGLTSIKEPTGRSTRYDYNGKGRLSGVRDSDGSLVISYDTYLMSDGGTAQNRMTSLRHLSEDGKVTVGDSEFYNGLGYLCQTISESASGDGANLIAPVEYDSMMRPDSKSYLPYSGKAEIWTADNNALANQAKWYSGDLYSQRPFVERTFESGASGRPLTEQKAGDIYQTANKRTILAYSLNESADSVFAFRYHYPTEKNGTPSITGSGLSAERTLARATVVNEDNDTTQTFTDAAGRLVLERRLNDGTRHDTYRIYDLKDSLVCIIQPTGSNGLNVGKGMPFNGTFIQDSCFTWRYDGKGRLIESHVPGAGTKSYLYDLRGRLIYMYDSNLMMANGSGWYFVYDDLGRVTESGTGIRGYSDSAILDGISRGQNIKTFLIDIKVLKEYDYYSGTTNTDAGFEPVEGLVSMEDVSTEHCVTMLLSERIHEVPYYEAPQRHQDGSIGMRLGATNGEIRRTYWYDRKGRVIQKLETTSDNWVSRYSTKYDFAGNAIATMEKHVSPSGLADSLLTVNTYDKRGRLVSYSRTLNGELLDSVFYSYDFAGRIQGKRLGGSSSAGTSSLDETYSRDIRGWMRDITVNTSKLGQVFHEYLGYMSPTLDVAPLFSGNISEVSMSGYGQGHVQNTYRYDHIGRLLGNDRYVDGVATTVGTEKDLRYDLNGNIISLTRDDGETSFTMGMSHIGNRIKECVIDLGTGGRFTESFPCAYDFNGNMTNVCQSGDIRYNILDLPHNSAGTTYDYYSDGTKAAVRDSTGKRFIYRGNFTYRQDPVLIGSDILWLESVRYPDGQILCGPLAPTDGNADCWHVKDHLGNVRALYCHESGGSLPVLEFNDYLPFGGRILNNAVPQLTANRFRYAGKEEYDNFAVIGGRNKVGMAANDFGARFLMPFISCWASPDPMASKSPSISPYSYCKGNPINYIDPFGLTNYMVNGKMYVINDGADETINVSRRQYKKLFNQMYDPKGHYWSLRSSIMDANGYTDAEGNRVLAAARIISTERGISLMSVASSLVGIIGGQLSDSQATYRLTNSKNEFDARLYTNGWRGNQYVKPKKVSILGKNAKIIEAILGTIDFESSAYQLSTETNPEAQMRDALDLTFGVIGFFPGMGSTISLIWSTCGNTLLDSSTNQILQQIDSTTGRLPIYYHMIDY